MNNKMINIEKEQKLFEKTCDAAVIVRDEHCSKRLARLYSNQILLNNIKIITAEELSEYIYLPVSDESPLKMIAEDKRVFSFYQTVLSNPKKQWMDNLNINGYFNAVHIAQQFYALFSELNENMIEPTAVEEIISDNQQQFDVWKIFCEIYKALETFLSSHGLTDKLYVRTKTTVDANINNILTLTSSYKSIVFLDCWGESPLAGYMLRAAYNLLSRTNKPEYILTVPDILINQQTWTLNFNEVTLDLLAGDNKKKFSFVKASSSAEICYKAVSCIAESPEKPTTIIDFDTGNNFYKYMLTDKIGIVPQIPYFNCHLYVWLDCMYKLLDSIIFNKSAASLLCDINVFRDVIYTDKFIGLYFRSEDKILLSELRHFVDDKINNEYIYFDINNTILQQEIEHWRDSKHFKPEEAEKFLSIASRLAILNSHIERILKIKCVSDLKDFLYNEIVSNRFFYDENFKVFETFFTAVEDTESLERMGIVTGWDKIFPNRERVPQVGINLLKILADYLKDQKVPLTEQTELNKSQLLWTSLDQYEWTSCGRLILLNMNEKVFPRTSFANSFFSEAQRISLKLPNSDDAVSQERLLLTDLLRLHDDITIISIENEAKDLFGSGFIDEIKFYCTRNNISFSNVDITFNDNYAALMQSILGETKPLSMNENIDPLLFSFDMDKDLENGVFRLSASRLKSLLKSETFEDDNQPRKTQNVLSMQTNNNHYTKYYLDNVIGIKFFEQKRIPNVSGRLLGNMVHDIYRDTIRRIKNEISGDNQNDKYDLTDIHWSKEHIQDTANHIISLIFMPKRNSYVYKVSDNWTKSYLTECIFPYAVKQLNRLFDKLRETFREAEVLINPEGDFDDNPEANTKEVIKAEDIKLCIDDRNQSDDKYREKPLEFNIPDSIVFTLDARADYSVESDNKLEIIDYKTGSTSSNHKVQLFAYEWVYSKSKANKEIASFFFNIFEYQDKEIFQDPSMNKTGKKEEDFPNTLFECIYKAVNPIFQLQYFAPNKKYIEKII